ncbi:DUF3265 domain-containing protein [Vibrio parahaemolyticus]|nr:DUF3265 domain-containing protein [Vibrio parahaemolyticus]MCR9890698.1 DUF3265 domain-containing protein [Vibrio parahaemolyticus]MCR9919468.1 DUF3265 domain-containing protein [Vibrio parahaemolyticus]MCX8819447.1 DUF3265 domain-containing protein [Vibrio parahaemolyticus]MCX8915834.1 DUF3265 domain-containing protein [Vibrio parahaemolyticus]MDF4367070.1 DUF3265 domain-containing protein [Vibrio parahaemolyticus]
MTNNLRGIPHAWHFWLGSSLVFKASKFSIVIAWLTP